jgi:hypothetical protein
MSSYPTDRKSCGYSIRYIRWLMHSGISSEIGPDAFALLVAVVMTEDEIHYQRPPNFYNEQLANRCGISTNSKHALIRARRIAIDAGLLWYEPGAKRRPGRYFVIGFSADSTPKVNRMCTESEPNVNPSIPIPIPIPNTDASMSVSVSPKAIKAKPGWTMPEGVDPIHWEDWLTHRKSKRASNTPSAWNRVEREATKAGLTIATVVQTCAERSWVGFESSWITPTKKTPTDERSEYPDYTGASRR